MKFTPILSVGICLMASLLYAENIETDSAEALAEKEAMLNRILPIVESWYAEHAVAPPFELLKVEKDAAGISVHIAASKLERLKLKEIPIMDRFQFVSRRVFPGPLDPFWEEVEDPKEVYWLLDETGLLSTGSMHLVVARRLYVEVSETIETVAGENFIVGELINETKEVKEDVILELFYKDTYGEVIHKAFHQLVEGAIEPGQRIPFRLPCWENRSQVKLGYLLH